MRDCHKHPCRDSPVFRRGAVVMILSELPHGRRKTGTPKQMGPSWEGAGPSIVIFRPAFLQFPMSGCRGFPCGFPKTEDLGTFTTCNDMLKGL